MTDLAPAKVDVWMPWFPKDYMASTALFSAEESGVYSLLLMQMWIEGGTLPVEHDRLARVGRISDPDRWAAIWRVISVKFQPAPGQPGRITQRRLDEVLAESRALKAAASDRGRAGAQGRWGKGKGPRRPRVVRPDVAVADPPADATAASTHMPTHCSSIALQSPPPPPSEETARAICEEPEGFPEEAEPPPDEPPEQVTHHHGVVRGLVPKPAHERPPDPDPLEPRARRMLELFSRVRIEVGKERRLTVLPWLPSEASVAKALALMRRLEPDRAAQADVEATMRLYLQRMSHSGAPRDRDPDWVFPCWAQRFGGLREEVAHLRRRERAGPATAQQVLAAWVPKEAWPPKERRQEGP